MEPAVEIGRTFAIVGNPYAFFLMVIIGLLFVGVFIRLLTRKRGSK